MGAGVTGLLMEVQRLETVRTIARTDGNAVKNSCKMRMSYFREVPFHHKAERNSRLTMPPSTLRQASIQSALVKSAELI